MKVQKIKCVILAQLKKTYPIFEEQTDVHLESVLFVRPRCLRLTYKGYTLFKTQFDSYTFTIPENLNAKHLIALSRHVDFPYYLTNKHIVLFGGEEAFIVKLFNNNIKLWLDSLHSTFNKK